jgi:dinuclear metal center YbgI/SA1388 family protein
MAALDRITAFLDRELRVQDFASDSSHNGLQVQSSGRVTRVCCGVDASLEFFREARRRGADLLVCHHGLSWGDSLKRITDLNYRRIRFLIENDMALYACHLPLDAHPRLGNNARICEALGLRQRRPFGLYRGVRIGFAGRLVRPLPYEQFKKRVARLTGGTLRTMDFGKRTVRTVAVVSGGGSEELGEAGRTGVDVFLSGEPTLAAYHQAQDFGINAVFAGHYATEVFGVGALSEIIQRRFRVPAEFVDLRVPY